MTGISWGPTMVSRGKDKEGTDSQREFFLDGRRITVGMERKKLDRNKILKARWGKAQGSVSL